VVLSRKSPAFDKNVHQNGIGKIILEVEAESTAMSFKMLNSIAGGQLGLYIKYEMVVPKIPVVVVIPAVSGIS
jgi:hypothetical protein